MLSYLIHLYTRAVCHIAETLAGCYVPPCTVSDTAALLARVSCRYDWIRVKTPVSDEDKALIKEFWCSETTLEGRPIVDGKVFK